MIEDIEDYWWAYFAGLMCGEGCLNVHLRKVHTARLYLEMTDKQVIEDVSKQLGLNVQARAGPRNDRCAPGYMISTENSAIVYHILEKITPFLVGNKKRQAELLQKFIELKKAGAPELELLQITRELRTYSGGDNREARARLNTRIQELEHAKMQVV